jgi:mono/diheme cytochrome c family protein
MDSTRDNPFIRFATFWWALGTFLIFGVLIAVIWAFNHTDPQTLEDVAAKARYKTKTEIFKAQAAAIPKEAITAAIATVGPQLAASKPVASDKPSDLIPGSKTAIEKEKNTFDPAKIDSMPVSGEAPDPAVMEIGKAQFLVCGACHGQNGEGTAAAPPLAGSEYVNGPISNLVLIQMRGLIGPIHVAGKDFNFPAGMTPMAYQTDAQIAGVLTYIRNSFGNKSSVVKIEQVTPARSEVGKPQLPTSELIKPEAAAK